MQPSPVLPTTFPAVQTEFCIFIKENDDWKLLHRDHLYITSAKGLGGWVKKMADFKVKKLLKGSLDSILSPSVKIQIMGKFT